MSHGFELGDGHWTLIGETNQSRSGDRLDLTRYGTVPPRKEINQTNSSSNLSLRREQPNISGRSLLIKGTWRF